MTRKEASRKTPKVAGIAESAEQVLTVSLSDLMNRAANGDKRAARAVAASLSVMVLQTDRYPVPKSAAEYLSRALRQIAKEKADANRAFYLKIDHAAPEWSQQAKRLAVNVVDQLMSQPPALSIARACDEAEKVIVKHIRQLKQKRHLALGADAPWLEFVDQHWTPRMLRNWWRELKSDAGRQGEKAHKR